MQDAGIGLQVLPGKMWNTVEGEYNVLLIIGSSYLFDAVLNWKYNDIMYYMWSRLGSW